MLSLMFFVALAFSEQMMDKDTSENTFLATRDEMPRRLVTKVKCVKCGYMDKKTLMVQETMGIPLLQTATYRHKDGAYWWCNWFCSESKVEKQERLARERRARRRPSPPNGTRVKPPPLRMEPTAAQKMLQQQKQQWREQEFERAHNLSCRGVPRAPGSP